MEGMLSRRYGTLLILCGIIGFQILVSLLRINEPILDARFHWYYDNAFFLLRAKHSNHRPSPQVGSAQANRLKVFGTAAYGYDEQGNPTNLTFYAHHPVLSPMLFRLFTQAFGYHAWVPRSYMLILSLLTTGVLYLLLNALIRVNWLSGLLTLLYTLLPLYFMYMDQWKYETLAVLLCLCCFYFLSKAEKRLFRVLFLACLFLMFHSEWFVYFTAPFPLFYSYVNRRQPGFRYLWGTATVVSLLAMGVNFWILHQMGMDPGAIRNVGLYRMGMGTEAVGLERWLGTQMDYLSTNFGQMNLAFFLMSAIFLAILYRHAANILLWAGFALIFSLVCHVGLFRNHSLIHHYAQWPFGPAYILLLGGILSAESARFFETGLGRGLAIAVGLPLLLFTAQASLQLNGQIRKGSFGSEADLAAISSLEKRLVVFSDGRSGPADWWFGPVIELAQDPIFQGNRRKGSVAAIEEISKLNPETDILVIANTKWAWNSFQQYCATRFGIAGFQVVKKTPSFSFLAFQAASP